MHLRIVFLADIHVNRYLGAEALERIVRIAADQRPDLVLLGGDYGESREGADLFFEKMKKITPPLGIFAVPGNNDLQHFDYDYDAIRGDSGACGINMLINDRAEIGIENKRILLCGTDDSCIGHCDTEGFFDDALPGDLKILLTHRPKQSVLDGLSHPCDLMLCGHTHGGQWKLFGLTPYSLFFEFRDGLIAVAGEKDVNGTRVIVTSGIGMSKFPIRINVPPEILVLTVGE